MKIIKSFFLFSLLVIFMNSCSSFSEAGKVLRNEKTRTTDEFLIEKKGPLSQPPDFKNIPTPGTLKNPKKENSSIEQILKTQESNPSNSKIKSSSTEDSILNQIRK
tara:strand:+ start:2066 stop:2383 length:318 start_codon:yes stop_codon:yes gene_type:complete